MIKEVIIVTIVLLIIFTIIVWKETEMRIFYPSRDMYSSVSSYQEFFIDENGHRRRDDCGVNVRLYSLSDDRKKIILFFHGNTGNISQRNYVVKVCKILRYNLLLLDYDGYGKSRGSPKTDGILANGLSAYRFLCREGFRGKDIIVWGESLGGGPSTWVARNYPCRSLILFSTYSSLSGVIDHLNSYPRLMRSSISALVRNYSSDVPIHEWLPHVHCPVVIVHSVTDDYIALDNAILNHQRANEPKKLIKIHGKHSQPILHPEDVVEILHSAKIDHRHCEPQDYSEICCILYNAAKDDHLVGRASTRKRAIRL